jgi:hypothetical protein
MWQSRGNEFEDRFMGQAFEQARSRLSVNVKGQVYETGSKLLHTWCIAQKLQPRRFAVDYTNSRKVEMYGIKCWGGADIY